MGIIIFICVIILIAGACSKDKGTRDTSNYQLGKIAARLGDEIARNLFR